MTKETCHGLPPSRAKGGHAPGNSPGPVGTRLRLGPTRYATTIHPPAGDGRSGPVTDPGTEAGNRAQTMCCSASGQEKSLRGSGWPPTNGIAWIRSGKDGTASACRGAVAGGGSASNRKAGNEVTSRDDNILVPMPRNLWGDKSAGGGSSFALIALWPVFAGVLL